MHWRSSSSRRSPGMRSVPITATAAGNGINALMRNLGNSTADAAMGAILGNATLEFDGMSVPTEGTIQLTLFISFAVAAVSALISIVIPRPRHRTGQHE